MSKHHRNTRGMAVNKGQGNQVQFEHQESFDDSLLPEAVELEKLKALDPDIMNWIKSRTEKEQDSRHDFNNRKMTLLEKESGRGYSLDVFSMVCALLIILSGMGFSTFLLLKSYSVTGSIFAGGTIVIAVTSFLNFRKVKSIKPPVKGGL